MPGSCTGSQGRCEGLFPLFPCLLRYATLFLPHTVCCVPSVCPNVVFLSLLHLRRRCFAHSPEKEVVAKSSPRPQAMNLLPLRLERLPLSPLQRSTPVSDLMARIKNTKMPFSIDFGVDDVIVPKQEKRKIPTQLDGFTEPAVNTYSLETTIAEKIDLLFFHRGLQRLVAFELKVGKFKPEYISKMDFYLEALDRQKKKENENPSVGMILCASKDDEVVEYAMSRILSPMMVAEYQLQLPDKNVLQKKLQELINMPLLEDDG